MRKTTTYAEVRRCIMWSAGVWLLMAATVFGQSDSRASSPTQSVHAVAAATHFAEGLDNIQRGRYRAAIRAFNMALSYDSTLAEAYLNIGACYARIGEFSRGIPFYESAIAHDERNPRLYYLYGVALIQHDMSRKGVQMLEQAAYLAPDNPDYLYNLGVGYAAITQYHRAVQCFEEVTRQLSPVPGAVWYNLGLALLRTGKTNAAENAWAHVTLDDPLAPQVYYWHAQLAAHAGAVTTALDHVKMALALDSSLVEARVLRADLYHQLHQYRRAATILEELYSTRPSRALEAALADVYSSWSVYAHTQGEPHDALRYIRRAVRYAPTDSALWVHMAHCALAVDDFSLAKDAHDRALQHARTAEEEEAIARFVARHAQRISAHTSDDEAMNIAPR